MSGQPVATTRPRRGPVPLKNYLARVIRSERITPHMHRVTIGGGDLQNFVSAAADQFITLILPRPGQERPLIDPAQIVAGDIVAKVGELDALPLARAATFPAQTAAEDFAADELQPFQLGQQLGTQQR